MKVWVTKYALTKGIFTVETEDDGADGMIADRSTSYTAFYHGEGRDWHKTKLSAVNKARQMRDAKIKALEKAIAKLHKLEFPK